MPLNPFHPAIRSWFSSRFDAPSPAQREGWPKIRAGHHSLVAAPTGSGKTLAAFLCAIDALARQGEALASETQVLYISPLKALSNDVQKNLDAPLAEIRAIDASFPEIRVLVRTGDTTSSQRAAMTKKPPHILVTTPESLYILLTSAGGRAMLATVRTVIVDEIHALARDKRGSHLTLSLERLEALAGPIQRIGLSATQKPIADMARFLCGPDRVCEVVDTGHLRELDLAIELPDAPLATVCSHETWGEIYERVVELIREHRTTLVFVNTRKLAERVAARLSEVLGEDLVTSHHGSLSKELRLDAEDRLKSGELRALVATASLELGIDIGPIDLVVQLGVTASIATLLQRVGRAGHGLGRVPRGRLFPLTIDELVASVALVSAVRRGELDRILIPEGALDILAQQCIASCVAEDQDEGGLFACFRRAWPYRHLDRADFDAVLTLHSGNRHSLLHRDRVHGRVRATKRARLTALTCGGAIPDQTVYDVRLEPEGTRVGSVEEDFAVESDAGDIFQLGNTSWRILKVEPGTVRVADAKGEPPTLPFWFGEAPARSRELSAEISRLREGSVVLEDVYGVPEAARTQIRDYFDAAAKALGALPTQRRIIAERFFDESGGMQLVVHMPFGGRVNRAFGLALRKRFCRGFGFELQAAANEEAIVLSLGPMHSFALEEIFDYLKPSTVRHVLTQACLTAPMFRARWRWNASRSFLVARASGGKRVAPALLRMRADDALAQSYPALVACPENLPAGDFPVPEDSPIVEQTIYDCLHELMDIDGLVGLLDGIDDGSIERVAVDSAEPSVLARAILNAQPYAFLDDAPLEERRTQAVLTRHAIDPKAADDLGALDPDAVARVREEAWPQPASVDELHEALCWMGYLADDEVGAWRGWLDELVGRGRLEALGPVFAEDCVELCALESEGAVLRVRLDGRRAWCERRLCARIHRYTVERLRREIEPASVADYERFLHRWQGVGEGEDLHGVLRRLQGFELPAAAWEARILPARLPGYRREWLDRCTSSGEFVWGRFWGSGASAIRVTPIGFVARADLPKWLAFVGEPSLENISGSAQAVLDCLGEGGALFAQEIAERARLQPAWLERALGELIARGLVTCDSFTALRQLLVPQSKRRFSLAVGSRWSLLREGPRDDSADLGFIARVLVERYGVVFRRVLERERIPAPWRDLVRIYRRLELRGDLRGGRFVQRFAGEQFALPEAIPVLRRVRKQGEERTVSLSSADPLTLGV